MQEIFNLPNGVFAEFPDRQNVRKGLVRDRLQELPAKSMILDNLHETLDEFTYCAAGESNFYSINHMRMKISTKIWMESLYFAL